MKLVLELYSEALSNWITTWLDVFDENEGSIGFTEETITFWNPNQGNEACFRQQDARLVKLEQIVKYLAFMMI